MLIMNFNSISTSPSGTALAYESARLFTAMRARRDLRIVDDSPSDAVFASGEPVVRDPVANVAPLTDTPSRRGGRKRPVAILKLPRFWSSGDEGRPSETVRTPVLEGLDAFGSESVPGLPGPSSAGAPFLPSTTDDSAPPSPSPFPLGRAIQWGASVLILAVLAIPAVAFYQQRIRPRLTTGSLTVETSPANLEVLIAGTSVGRTPLTLPLAVGAYDVEVGPLGRRRAIKASVSAGATSVHHVEFAPMEPTAVATDTGTLRVQTEPANLAVIVDGIVRGSSPVTIERLPPGDHDVAVRAAHGIVHKTVKLQARESLSLIVSGAAPVDAAATGGWLSVESPIVMQMREGGKVIGTTESERVMLPAGDHEVEVVNEALGFRTVRKVRVVAGKTATARIDLPKGSLSVNAQPWAEVWIDGARVGETPIGNLQWPIGTHQVVFRHPEFGERREAVVITLQQPVRLGVDLRKKQ